MPSYVIRVISGNKDRICTLDKWGNNDVTDILEDVEKRRDELKEQFPTAVYQIYELKPVIERKRKAK